MNTLNEPLQNRNGKLFIDGVSIQTISERFDTPLYVISETRIRNNYTRLLQALTHNYEKVEIFYAMKANSNLAVLKILESEGANVDTVSPGEVFMALTSGFTPERILFTGNNVRTDEIKFISDGNITINIDSLSQLDRLLKFAVPKTISVRVNPEVGAGAHSHLVTAGKETKFGLWETDALKAYAIAKKAGVKHFGIQMHIGSGILDVKPFVSALEKLLNVAKRVHEQSGIDFEFIDVGGGIGVPYKLEDKALDLQVYSDKVLSLFKSKIHQYGLGEPVFCVEPGRYLVADASLLLTSVNTVKTTPYKKFVGVDAGFNTLVRPTMYGSYHPIVVANKLDVPEEEKVDVAGPICESGDLLARDRRLPPVEEGDLLAILNAGAYGFSMSSQYNMRPRAAEVLVKEGKYKLVREREQLDDLMSSQKQAAEWEL
ncbi:MAG TPA: diaminopimelate decarboxylase [Candidatus Nanoarchaeia archaeon]|nr:diaminopimelate decarboxylase [Candidatus Nanoarchaeia archaeon]